MGESAHTSRPAKGEGPPLAATGLPMGNKKTALGRPFVIRRKPSQARLLICWLGGYITDGARRSTRCNKSADRPSE